MQPLLPLITRTPGVLLDDHDHISMAIPVISHIVRRLRECIVKEKDPHVKYELEARFGNYHANKFQPGVSSAFMTKVMQDLASFDSWHHITPCHEMHDFIYFAPDLKSNVRSSVSFTENNIKTTHIKKDKIESVILKMHRDPYTFISSIDHEVDLIKENFDLRIDLSREEEIVNESRLPILQNTTHMRIKQRTSYFYASPSSHANIPSFQYDLTFAWSGTNKNEAEQSQKTSPPICEIECEFLNPRRLVIDPECTDEYVATSLLYKMADFVSLSKSSYAWPPR